MNPKISVLMSVYNNETTVDASIASIAAQTHSDWELILVNDSSTDRSLEVLSNWAKRDNRIRLFSNGRNMGLTASLNRALEKARGEYIARMDGDDVSLPQRFELQAAFLDAHPEHAIVGSSAVLFDREGEWGTRAAHEMPRKKDFLWGSQFIHPSVMMRRSALLAVHGYRDCPDTLRTEDYDMFMRMYASGFSGYNLSEPLLRYYDPRMSKPVHYHFRINEAKVRLSGFRALGLMPIGLIYVIKPLVVGLLPGKLKRRLQQRQNGVKEGEA
jgi:glycosyltransferase involved in cell wall biosynthesis